jgi:hypothetical protein
MSTIRLLIVTILFALIACSCQSVTPTPQSDGLGDIQPVSETDTNPLVPIPGEKSMKGYELYSWQKDSQWYFSILIGTNRGKTLEEIQSSAATLSGMDELRSVLETIPTGEYITWLLKESLAFPPKEIIAEVQEICAKKGLELGITQ